MTPVRESATLVTRRLVLRWLPPCRCGAFSPGPPSPSPRGIAVSPSRHARWPSPPSSAFGNRARADRRRSGRPERGPPSARPRRLRVLGPNRFRVGLGRRARAAVRVRFPGALRIPTQRAARPRACTLASRGSRFSRSASSTHGTRPRRPFGRHSAGRRWHGVRTERVAGRAGSTRWLRAPGRSGCGSRLRFALLP